MKRNQAEKHSSIGVAGVLINEDKLTEHLMELNGICIECGAVDYHRIEPDAVNYVCHECGERGVMGMAEAVISEIVIPSKKRQPILREYMKDDKL